MARKVLYKNHCTPQEQISSGGRYYLDSDCGRRLTGVEEFTLGGSSVAYVSSEPVTTTPESLGADKDFVFIKNTSGDDVLVAFDGNATYHTKLSNGEALAVQLRGTDVSTNEVYVKSDGTSTIEYYTGT